MLLPVKKADTGEEAAIRAPSCTRLLDTNDETGRLSNSIRCRSSDAI